jgi:DNA polymerase-1
MTPAQNEPLQSLTICPAYARRIAALETGSDSVGSHLPHLPLAAARFAGKLTVVATPVEGKQLVKFVRQRPVSHIGLDFEFSYGRPGVFLKRVKGKDRHWYDPRSIIPLLLGVAVVEERDDGSAVMNRFAIDLRPEGVAASLFELFRTPVMFAAHFVKQELFCEWQLGLPTPDQVWDTWVAERAAALGVYHRRYATTQPGDEPAEEAARAAAEEAVEARCDLANCCLRHGVPYKFGADKKRLQASFLCYPLDQPFTDEQFAYVAADATGTAALYKPQVLAATRTGALNHLLTVEMPWAVTNALLEWDGVRVDAARCHAVRDSTACHARTLQDELAALGLQNAKSDPQLLAFFRRQGLVELFRVGSGYSFADKLLEAVEHRHAAIPLIRDLRKVVRLGSDKLLTGELVGADGRLHPHHRQLGAESTRNTMSAPNVGGVGRVLRPLVVSDCGCGIGEVDLSQIEVGIAAAVFNVPELIAMFNGRDVYSAMARQYYADRLPADAAGLSDETFKTRYGAERDRMKVFTLATIYNITPRGLATQLGIPESRAAAEQAQFLGLFPGFADALESAVECGVIRGFATLCTGLRRRRGGSGHPSSWERNWLRNTPVQGSAAVVFKVAGNRLRRRFHHFGARLILPMHDAYVFEAPLDRLAEVAEVVAETLRSTVQEYFPCLSPQVKVNLDHPQCWNKDGKWKSLDLWLKSPAEARKYLFGQ